MWGTKATSLVLSHCFTFHSSCYVPGLFFLVISLYYRHGSLSIALSVPFHPVSVCLCPSLSVPFHLMSVCLCLSLSVPFCPSLSVPFCPMSVCLCPSLHHFCVRHRPCLPALSVPVHLSVVLWPCICLSSYPVRCPLTMYLSVFISCPSVVHVCLPVSAHFCLPS